MYVYTEYVSLIHFKLFLGYKEVFMIKNLSVNLKLTLLYKPKIII